MSSVPENSGSGAVDLASREGKTSNVPPSMGVFHGVVPVPMRFPGEEYGTKKPWFYCEGR
jgi:hypothetical protein